MAIILGIQIDKGGQVNNLKGNLKAIRFEKNDVFHQGQLWLEDEDGNESMSYLSVGDLLELKVNIQEVLEDIINDNHGKTRKK